MAQKEESLLTVQDVAEWLQVSPKSVRKWADDGLIACVRIGERGDRRFLKGDVEAYIEGQRQPAKSVSEGGELLGELQERARAVTDSAQERGGVCDPQQGEGGAPAEGANTPACAFDGRMLARLAGGGAMWVEVQMVLEQALVGKTAEDVRRLIVDGNVVPKRTLANRKKTAKKLIERYILDWRSVVFRAFWYSYRAERSESQRALIAYLLLCANDALVRRIGLEWLAPRFRVPNGPVSGEELQQYLEALAKQEPAIASWSSRTRERYVQHYLGAVRDFGMAEGRVNKRVVRPAVSTGPTLFAARLARLQGLSARDTLGCDWFRLLGLEMREVIGKLYDLNAAGVAKFRAQGDVVELTLPPLEGTD